MIDAASDSGLSVSEFIRRSVGIKAAEVKAIKVNAGPVVFSAAEHSEASLQEHDQVKYAAYTKLVKQLKAQGNDDAEEVARKRLGIE